MAAYFGAGFILHVSLVTCCAFCLWISLEGEVYKTHLHTMEVLKCMSHEILTTFREELQSVDEFRTYPDCVWSGGQEFQHLIRH